MAVTETEFHAKAEVSLQQIFESLDASNLDCVDDLGYEDGVLTVKLEGGRTFVINKHYVTRQIWYASPVSGALYFNLQAGHSSNAESFSKRSRPRQIRPGEPKMRWSWASAFCRT
eukprot:g21735.t1